jgi:hypothetical protein
MDLGTANFKKITYVKRMKVIREAPGVHIAVVLQCRILTLFLQPYHNVITVITDKRK